MRNVFLQERLVSSPVGRLDAELEAWRERRLESVAYPHLFVDARYEKVREDHLVVSQGVLVVSAVGEDGMREILGVEVADTESEATYQGLFRSLKRRGLSGVELVVSDAHEGLKAAVERHFRGACWQRCQVHYARRNLLGLVGAIATQGAGGVLAGRVRLRRRRRRCGSPRSWPTGGEGATRRSPSTSKSTSRSASRAWASRRATAGASARPMRRRGSTRR